MFTSDISLGSTVYSLRTQRTNSSVRGDATQPINEPNSLTISHEVAGSGRVSSVVILDDTKVVQIGTSAPTSDVVKTLLKIQYNPLAGRTDIVAAINAQLTQLAAFIAVPANVTKLMNRES